MYLLLSMLLPLLLVAAAAVVAVAEATVAASGDVETHSEDVDLDRSLRFEPAQLDFGTWAVGTAHAHTVTLVNQNANRSVYLSSVSGRTPAFYSSFFESKVVPPQGNTTFSVVFLPRAHGTVASDLLVHTSFGQARLMVRGVGRECPYRLKPIVGVRAPLNATLTPEIHMYNPHGRPLQILEVYSSGGQFQLELPSGGQEGNKALWEIPPHSEKPVIRIRFQGRSAGNHTAYIRIKISEQPEDALAASENVLVIPVEFEILPQHGLYAQNPVLDFGRLTTTKTSGSTTAQQKPPLPLRLQLALRQSHERRQHEITDYEVSGGGGGDDGSNTSVGLSFDAESASLTLDPALFATTTSVDTTLRLRTASKRNASQTLELTLLVRAEIFKGTLEFDRNTTIFVTQPSDSDTAAAFEAQVKKRRTLTVRNDFEQPLALLNITGEALNASSHFASTLQVRLSDAYAAGIVLAPGQTLPLLQLQLLQTSDGANFHTTLLIHTNVTNFEVPLIVCPGRLHVSTRSDAHVSLLTTPDDIYNLELNLGAIPLAEMSHSGFIVLRNLNPLAIKLSTWDFQSPKGVYFTTIFLGCLRANATGGVSSALTNATDGATVSKEEAAAAARATTSNLAKNDTGGLHFKFCTHLAAGDVAVFEVAIQSYITDDHAASTLKLLTPYETITTKIKFRTWMGKLEVDQEQLYFKNCFPGKLCSSDLSIRSTFKHPIHIDSINFTDAGLRFEDLLQGTKAGGSTIAANAVTKVGRIYFEPAQLCQNRCYIPQDEKTAAIAFPAPHDTKGGANNNLHFDETELRRRTELFRHLKWYFQTIAFTLNSREVRQFQLQLIIDIEWPKLVEGGRQTLPTIEVGKVQQLAVVVSNPADSPILVDYFLADPQYAKETQLSLPFEVVDISSNCYLTDKSVFSLADSAGDSHRSQPLLVPAQSSIAVTVSFIAHEADTHCTLLHIRNNLTLYEAVWLSGKTVQSQFRFGNRKPGSTTPLLFEVSEKYMAACAASDDLSPGGVTATKPLFLTKRTFTARNTGEIPIWIETFIIGGDRACEGYGFRVLDCTSFELKANASKKIEIAFRPDFTALRVTRSLTLRTNLSYDVEYVLVAQLPGVGASLDACAEQLPRPPWEPQLRNAAIWLLSISFLLVLLAAHADHGDIMVRDAALYESRDKAPTHPTFNLRNIATNKAPETIEAPAAEEAPSAQAVKNKSPPQQRTASSGANNLKKRGAANTTAAAVKKASVNGGGGAAPASGIGRNMSLVDLSWPLDSDAGGSAKITTPTFSERNFKLRLLAEKNAAAAAALATASASAQSSSNPSCISTPNESRAKSNTPPPAQPVPPKTITSSEKEMAAAATTPTTTTTTLGVKKQPSQQRASKKFKNTCIEKPSDEPQRSATATQSKTATATTGGHKYAKAAAAEKIASPEAEALEVQQIQQQQQPQSATRHFVSKDGGGSVSTRGKHGKTPGRERRKEATVQQHNANAGGDAGNAHLGLASSCSTSSASSSSSGEVKRGGGARKQRMRAAQLNLNAASASAPAATKATFDALAYLSLSSPWETSNPVSFSDVLQLTSHNSPICISDPAAGDFAAALLPEQVLPQLSDGEHTLLDVDLSDSSLQSNSTIVDTTPEKASNSTELGPIGSKKSPSTTPVWEPIGAAASALQLPKPTSISNNSSFFSNLLPTTTTTASTAFAAAYEDVQPNQFMGVPTGLFELKPTPGELQSQWQNHDYILSMRHQQMQQQQLLHNGSNSSSGGGIDALGNWTGLNSSNTWSPLSYGHGGSIANNIANASATAMGGAIEAAAATSALGPWQNAGGGGGGIVRPPPGLEANYQNVIHHAHQQQQLSAAATENVLPPQASASDMQTFDPFSSLSSIWSDTWNTQPRNN